MEPAWLRFAYEELRKGIREQPGESSESRILRYFEQIGASNVQSDETAWCAAFVGSCLSRAGIELPEPRLRARSYLGWGARLSAVHPPVGAILVLTRGHGPQPGREVLDAPGHVGFFWGHSEPGCVLLLGGNQGNRVGINTYYIHRLLGVRWPEEK
jgi:uncharacterized protein (TIGR02594 family)